MAIDPIQSGDGSQAAVASAPRAPGFTPSPLPTNGTNVAAPLDVRAGPSQASLLAGQLETSLQSLRWPMMQAERAHGEQAAKQNYDKGSADALANQVSDDVMQKDANYRAGVVRVRAQHSMIVASDAWQQWVADPKNNVAGMSPTQFTQAHDQFMRQQLGGLEQDPVAVDALMPLIQHSANESLGRFLQFKHQQNFSDGLTTSVQLAQAQLQHGGNLFDYEKQLSTLTALAVGAGHSRSDAKATLDNSLIQAAVAGHSGGLLNMIQPAPGQKALAPATQLAVSEARDSITRYNAEQTAQATQQRQSSVLSAWDVSLMQKTPIAQSAITEAMHNGVITPQAGLMYSDKSDELRKHLQAGTAATTAINSGTPLYTLVGQQIPGAKPGKVFTPELLQKHFDARVGALPQEQRIAAAVRGTQQQGYVYSPLASTANNEPINTAQGVKDVLGLYNGLNSIDASVTGKYFNPRRRAEVSQLVQMKQSGMSEADIATWVQKHGEPETPEAVGVKASAINAGLSSWTVPGPRAHWYTPAGHSNLPVLDGIANPGQVASRVKMRAAFLAQSGICTPDVCVSEAGKQIQDESYTIDVGNGHSLVIPMAKSDPPPGLSQPALQSFFDNHAVQIANVDGWHGDKSELRIVPNTVQPGTYTLMDATGRTVSRDTFTLAGIVSAYQKDAFARIQAQQQTAAARATQREQARLALATSTAD